MALGGQGRLGEMAQSWPLKEIREESRRLGNHAVNLPTGGLFEGRGKGRFPLVASRRQKGWVKIGRC